jgi:dethiobiotin synthase
MLRGFFVTGTDTNIGKTVVSAALMHRYRELAPLRYWKPVQTGCERDDDTATVRELGNCTEAEILNQGVRLPRPLSPHLAAQLAGARIELEPLMQIIAAQPAASGWVIEGAGGALVPINEKEMMTDLMAQLALPVIVVVRSGLGTINHTLLTLEALRRRSLRVAGVVMIGEPNTDNRAAIERYGEVAVLGEMPRFTSLTAEALGHWARVGLDPFGLLKEYFNE